LKGGFDILLNDGGENLDADIREKGTREAWKVQTGYIYHLWRNAWIRLLDVRTLCKLSKLSMLLWSDRSGKSAKSVPLSK
jgi:hypothetical protein